MTKNSEFAAFLEEQFERPIAFKRMFGGYGLFEDGIMIGLIADDTLYFKSDAESDPEFDRVAAPRFTYQKRDKQIEMSFRQCPPDALEDRESLETWRHIAHAAAWRSKKR